MGMDCGLEPTLPSMSNKHEEYQRPSTTLDIADGFKLYNARSSVQDENFVKGCNQTMDTLLVFAGLFSAIVTAFMIQNLQLLGDNSQRTNEILTIIAMQLNSSSFANTTAGAPSRSGPSGSEKANIIFTCSLVITLIAALSGILVKQWVHEYQRRVLSGKSSRERARSRAVNWNGIESYHLIAFISMIPILLHVGLALFFGGLLTWALEGISVLSFVVACTFVVIGFVAYTVLAIIACSDSTSPFQWSLSVSFRAIRSWCSTRRCSKRQRPDEEDIPASSRPLETIFPAKPVTLVPSYAATITGETEFYPLDLQILSEVIITSHDTVDICRALEQIRCTMLLPDFDIEALGFPARIKHRGNPLSSMELMLLKTCTNIISLSMLYTGTSVTFKHGWTGGARCAASFLETYLQFTSKRTRSEECFDLIRNSPLQELVTALLQTGLSVGDGSPSDVVLAVSLRAKLSHHVYRAGSKCTLCFSETATTRWFVTALKHLMETGGGNKQRVGFIHQLLYIFFASLSDCLCSYCEIDDAKWGFIVKYYQAPLKDLLEHLQQATPIHLLSTPSMVQLRSFTRDKRLRHPDDSRKVAWLDTILSYCAPPQSKVNIQLPVIPPALPRDPQLPNITWDMHPDEVV